jgi:uncharacterized membrane protein HdeD (DUF308 family)/alpha-beta hydrolase superfamily lysophospholipase
MTAAHDKRMASGPWAILLGLVTVGFGVLAIASPLVSRTAVLVALVAGALAAGLLLLLTRSGRPWQVAGGIWLVAGVVMAFWPDHSFPALSTLVGIGLLGSGSARLVELFPARPRLWGALLASGAIALVGIGTIVWANVTIAFATTVLGIHLLTLGAQYLLDHGTQPAHHKWGILRTVGAGALTLLVIAALVIGGRFAAGIPEPDSFYDPPADLPAEPGVLLRAEPFTQAIPEGTEAWRILYTTTRDDQTPAVASGVVMVPATRSADPLPVITWAHGTSGFAEGCAPSILPDTYNSKELYLIEQAVTQKGWAVVATDYVGLGTRGPHPYLVGDQEARSVLDATRAARQLEELSLQDETVVWGHSQGGHSALWTGQIAESYASDAGVIAVAALAPASNLPALVNSLETLSVGSMLGAYVLEAYSQIYPDVNYDDVVTPRSQVLVEEIAYRCLHEPAITVSLVSALILGADIYNGDPMNGPMGPHLRANVPLAPIEVPLLIAQGLADQVIAPPSQDQYVQERCAMGTALDYRTYPGLDHMPLVEVGSQAVPDVLQWTQDRWDGKSATNTC